MMVGYLWATFGTMTNLPASKSGGALNDIFVAVQNGFWGSHAWAVIIALIALWFFVSNTVVYNYSFSRLLFVSGLERRMPAALGKVNDRTRVPVNAVLAQTVLASAAVAAGIYAFSEFTHRRELTTATPTPAG